MLIELQRAILKAVVGDEPFEAEPDGLLLTKLLVRKLRFERICRGDSAMKDWFERDPEGFTAAFRVYHRAVPPKAYFPRQEAQAFRDYCRTLPPNAGFARNPRSQNPEPRIQKRNPEV